MGDSLIIFSNIKLFPRFITFFLGAHAKKNFLIALRVVSAGRHFALGAWPQRCAAAAAADAAERPDNSSIKKYIKEPLKDAHKQIKAINIFTLRDFFSFFSSPLRKG